MLELDLENFEYLVLSNWFSKVICLYFVFVIVYLKAFIIFEFESFLGKKLVCCDSRWWFSYCKCFFKNSFFIYI